MSRFDKKHETNAEKKRNRGTDGRFKKGNKFKNRTPNPHWRNLPQEVREVVSKNRALTKEALARMINYLGTKNYDQLTRHVENPKTTVYEMILGNIMLEAARDGDPHRMNFILDRSIGKVKEQIEHEVKPVKYVTEVSSDGALLQSIVEEEKTRSAILGPAPIIDAQAEDIDPAEKDVKVKQELERIDEEFRKGLGLDE